jgi:hypothetical protein
VPVDTLDIAGQRQLPSGGPELTAPARRRDAITVFGHYGLRELQSAWPGARALTPNAGQHQVAGGRPGMRLRREGATPDPGACRSCTPILPVAGIAAASAGVAAASA